MKQNILLASMLSALLCSSIPAFAAISLDLSKGDELRLQSTIVSESDSEFVYIVQVEDEEGYTVFLDYHEDSAASDVFQTITFNWRPENDGIYSVKTFVWSSLENPIPIDSLIRDLQIEVNGENRAACSGSARCFTGVVTKVVDGDTLDVGDIRIRLALVNTPELDEQGYEDAKDFTSELCPVGSNVLIDQDDMQLEDIYGRMLATVTCGDNKNLNAELLSNGYAGILREYCSVSEFSSKVWAQNRCTAETPEEQIMAANNAPNADAGRTQSVDEETLVALDGTGSWDFDGDDLSYSWEQTAGPFVLLKNTNTATPSFTSPSVNDQTKLVFMLTVSDGDLTDTDNVDVYINDVAEEDSNPPPPIRDESMKCDPSYPTVCIPPPPPDLDCGEISYRNFKVLQPDPHRFDGDKDGIGCET